MNFWVDWWNQFLCLWKPYVKKLFWLDNPKLWPRSGGVHEILVPNPKVRTKNIFSQKIDSNGFKIYLLAKKEPKKDKSPPSCDIVTETTALKDNSDSKLTSEIWSLSSCPLDSDPNLAVVQPSSNYKKNANILFWNFFSFKIIGPTFRIRVLC